MITPTTPLAEDGLGSRTVHSLDSIRGYDRPFSRVSWGAIFAGALFALATQVVLTLLGLSIGLATIDPASGSTPAGSTLGMGAGIWMLVSTIISLFLGGYIAGRLAGTFNGWIHGLITWAACT
ncbi:MAG: PhnA-like protein, partial [Verrucomicrobiaceae bacterium]